MSAPRLGPRWAGTLLGSVLVLLVLVQVTLLNFLPTPWAVPDVVVVTVLALSVVRGPLTGALAGAWAGLLLDVLPPAVGPLGGWMLVLAVVAAALGRVSDTYRPGPVAAMVLVAAAAGIVVLGGAAVLWFGGVPAQVPAVGSAVAGTLWGLILAPVALLIGTRTDPSGPARSGSATRPGVGADIAMGGGRR